MGRLRGGGGRHDRDGRPGAPLPGDPGRPRGPRRGGRAQDPLVHPGADRGPARGGPRLRADHAAGRGRRGAPGRRLRRKGGPGDLLGGPLRVGGRPLPPPGEARAAPPRRPADDRQAAPVLIGLPNRGDGRGADPRVRGDVLPGRRGVRRPLAGDPRPHALPLHEQLRDPQRAGHRQQLPHEPAAQHGLPGVRGPAGDVRHRGRDQRRGRRLGGGAARSSSARTCCRRATSCRTASGSSAATPRPAGTPSRPMPPRPTRAPGSPPSTPSTPGARRGSPGCRSASASRSPT